MPPPAKPAKPKTKKELRAEEAAARAAAEEERLRQEEEARRVAALVEERRQQLLADFNARRDARLEAERKDLAPLLLHMQQQRRELAAAAGAVAEWERYRQCSPLPDPRDRPAFHAFLSSLPCYGTAAEQAEMTDLEKTLQQAEACLQLAEQCLALAAEEGMAAVLHDSLNALLVPGPASSADACSSTAAADTQATTSSSSESGSASADAGAQQAEASGPADDDRTAAAAPEAAAPVPAAAWGAAAAAAASDACRARAAQHQQDASTLQDSICAMLDAATAHVLHHADEYADPSGKSDVLLTAQQGPLQWGLWVNTQKNPRFKLAEFTGLAISVEIPKQLALANIALRVECKGWTIRQVSPQSGSISTVPYPIPPVGADPSTWRPDAEPPALHFSMRLPERLLVPAAVRVGWWDASQQAWSQEGVSNTSYDGASGRLTFSTTHLGSLALLQDSSAHLPYSAWTIRPTGGLGGSTATIDLQVPGLPSCADSSGAEGSTAATVSLEVGSGWARLLRGPALPQLGHLVGKALPPSELLSACEACGLRLSPGSRELAAVGVWGKGAAAEQAMCADVAILCTKFLVASSRWNQAVGQDVVLVRLSEVQDWEEGGRTSSQAAARIFGKEATEGQRRVLIARREAGAAQGVSWSDGGGDNQPGPPVPPDLSSVEAVLAATQAESAWMHASLVQLLDTAVAAQRAEHDGQAGGTPISSYLQDCFDVDAGFQGSMVQLLQALHVFAF